MGILLGTTVVTVHIGPASATSRFAGATIAVDVAVATFVPEKIVTAEAVIVLVTVFVVEHELMTV